MKFCQLTLPDYGRSSKRSEVGNIFKGKEKNLPLKGKLQKLFELKYLEKCA